MSFIDTNIVVLDHKKINIKIAFYIEKKLFITSEM